MQQRLCAGRVRLAALALLGVAVAGPAMAQVSTTRGSSLLFFPKIVNDASSDTMIQVSNVTNNLRHAFCYYVTGDPNDPSAAVVDFELWLTPRQPTHWVASRGRRVDPTDAACDQDNLDCDGAGIDPSRIPPAPVGFHGYLSCVEVDTSGFPVPGNAFVGKATITAIDSGDIATYSAIGSRSLDSNNMDDVLCLGGGVSSQCPTGAEYDSCPVEWILQHPTAGSADPLAGEGSEVDTSIAVLPCSYDLATRCPTPTLLRFEVTNEFEQTLHATLTVDQWADMSLSSISTVFDISTIGGVILQTRITGQDEGAGFVVIGQIDRSVAGATTSTAAQPHADPASQGSDVIVIPGS